MRREPAGFLRELLGSRAMVFEILVVAVCLGVAVNLLSNSVPSLLHLEVKWVAISGAVLGSVSLIYVFGRVFRVRTRDRILEGLLLYDHQEKKLLEVPRYRFGYAACWYTESAFTENSALKAIWEREPLVLGTESNKNKAYQLVREVVEYFALESLSTHLTDYFNQGNVRTNTLQTFKRSDIPDVLLQNRFLELFSKSMEERPAFLPSRDSNSNATHRGEVILSTGSRGARYARFDLVLPKGSTVTRAGACAVQIATRRLVVDIEVQFNGTNTIAPWRFLELLVGTDHHERVWLYGVTLVIRARFKWWALLSPVGWQYYGWLDSFLDKLESEFSKDAFVSQIGWEQAETALWAIQQNLKQAPVPKTPPASKN